MALFVVVCVEALLVGVEPTSISALPLVFGVVETLRAQCVHDRGAAEDA